MVDWGDLAELARTPNPALAKIFVISDVDFEQDNTRQQLSSCDGIVGHDETLRLINRWARDKHQNMILFHRKGWAAALDVKALKNIKRKSACFVATACCESAKHPAVQTLRRFHDERLTRHRPGRGYIRFYEQVSPPVADLIRTRAWVRRLVGINIRREAGPAASAIRRRERMSCLMGSGGVIGLSCREANATPGSPASAIRCRRRRGRSERGGSTPPAPYEPSHGGHLDSGTKKALMESPLHLWTPKIGPNRARIQLASRNGKKQFNDFLRQKRQELKRKLDAKNPYKVAHCFHSVGRWIWACVVGCPACSRV
ncbi:MAG TPA: hypothetical protein PLB55_19425 [Prosthecobacter sp.]|nr:hypothetical protein [Prosthecobacter sp.]